jgi:hypothetical protein
MSQLNRAQRIVIVVALGALFILLGAWLTRLGSHPAVGWVGSAPLNHSVSDPGRDLDLPPAEPADPADPGRAAVGLTPAGLSSRHDLYGLVRCCTIHPCESCQ